jgi:DNA-binding response OmpR family regulator
MSTVLIVLRKEYSLLTNILVEEGHRVIEAFDSGHVLQHVMRQSVDAIILPEDAEPVDGEELLPVIRRLTAASIVVVGEGGEPKMAEALFRGADAFLRYPDEPARLRSRLRAILRRRARRPVEKEQAEKEDEPNPKESSFLEFSWLEPARVPAI